MNKFDDREKSFEKKFAHDEELKFKVSARRNKYIGEWVSKELGYNSDQEKEYIQSVIKADFEDKVAYLTENQYGHPALFPVWIKKQKINA